MGDEKQAYPAFAGGRVSSGRFEEKITKIEILWLTAQRVESSISNLTKFSNVADTLSSGIFYCSFEKYRMLSLKPICHGGVERPTSRWAEQVGLVAQLARAHA
ncbi:MAG: hypothetical protein ACYSOZ_07515 [Planctomycetota bacterium]